MALLLILPEPFLLAFVVVVFLACSAGSAVPASPPVPGASTSNAVTADRLALMSFKSLIESDPSQALASWEEDTGGSNRSAPMCQWRGVECGVRGRRRGRVVALDLSELNLLGTISPALGNLTFMRRLYLQYNRFHGVLPHELGNLHDLEILQLRFNSIEGQIPPLLSNCRNLANISFYGNKLQGEIPSELSSLHNLKVLSLGQNTLTGSIPSDIGSLVNLKLLVVEFNNLTGEIPPEIGNLVNLSTLGLSYNQFSGTIPASLGNLSSLTLLSIGVNNLRGSIPPQLQGLSSLKTFELSQNQLEGTIPPWLGNLSSLTFLNLRINSFVGQIPESLGNLEMLTNLGLSYNNLSGSVPPGLGNLHNLVKIHLGFNQLEGQFPPSIFNISSLEILSIENNSFTGSFPPDMGNTLPKLRGLTVDSNRFSGIIPQSLCNISTLAVLQAYNNLLSGTIPQCLGARQQNLSVVTLTLNLLEATSDADWGFLSSLTNCTNLRTLDFSSNRFQGALPNSIGHLSSTHLTFLNMEKNKLSGTIPDGIGNLVNLGTLYMNDNLFKGSIPASLSKMSMLTRLYLQNNNLTGSIPRAIGNLTSLSDLALQGNALVGAIPSSLRDCPLEKLDLSHNFLTGSIPKELFLISTLSGSMRISHNLLIGSLPSELGNLKNLGALDFSENRISGEIPTAIGECQSLEYLNTSGNILRGAIPQSLGKLKGLLVLDLSHNNLSGAIPGFLGSMPGLSSLNLSFNKLDGEVPKDGVFLNATAILITENDGLCGGIPELKLPPCSNHTTKKTSRKLAMIISICSPILLIILVLALLTFYRRSRKMKEDPQTSLISEKYIRVSYAELINATNGFASDNLVGAGSFGSVYKGRMTSNDQQVVVAVKVLNLMQRGASQSFAAECETLKCVRHRNLVRILTVCSSIDFQGNDFKALVYEFLPNGNLDQWLHKHPIEDGEHKALDLNARLSIAIDVASSLDYLHQHKPKPIIHCDLKPSNVLLDSDMVAHVGDFGLARFLHQDSEKSSGWASLRGTIGYAAPEYGQGNEVSIHGDVYSYGVLLLEMFSGKRPTESAFGEALGLRKYVQMMLPDRVGNVIDHNLLVETEDGEASTSASRGIREMKIACIASILHVGVSCSEEIPTDRMQIEDALKELQAIRDKFQKELLREGAPRH